MPIYHVPVVPQLLLLLFNTQFTPVEWLKEFYWEGYNIVRESAPQWLFLMHDAFMFDVGLWGDFM